MPKQEKERICFVIAPIGEEGSETRRRSDQILKHIITPAATNCGYETIRADKISEPGIITSQVIQHLVDDALVIADLTGRNPNVFYELAIRHAVRKPVVQIIQIGEPIPFDVAATRTIQVDHHDLDSVSRCTEELAKQIGSAEKDPSDVDTPISVAIDLQSLRRSENPLEKSSAEMISMLQDIRSVIGDIVVPSRPPRLHPGMLEETLMSLVEGVSTLDLMRDEEPTRERFERAQHSLYRSMDMLKMLVIESGLPPNDVERLVDRIGRFRPRIK